MLRPEFVQRKLHLIAEDLGRLAHFREEPFEAIVGDFVKLAAVERILERIVMRAIDVNEHPLADLATGAEERITRLTYRDTFLRLADHGVYSSDFATRIALSAGLRNILVHDYNDVDRRILYDSIRSCLEQYQHYVRSVEEFLKHREPVVG